MTQFDAIMIVEGVEPVETEEEYIKALQSIIDSGIVWKLQGSFGRTAADFINRGLCHYVKEK